jgi:hypothetical protein
MSDREILRGSYFGFQVYADDDLGHLWVTHDGSITWDQLQAIKSAIWGDDARAIEVYPSECDVVDTVNCRHLWRLGQSDFAPDLLGHVENRDRLETRYAKAWSEAHGAS